MKEPSKGKSKTTPSGKESDKLIFQSRPTMFFTTVFSMALMFSLLFQFAKTGTVDLASISILTIPTILAMVFDLRVISVYKDRIVIFFPLRLGLIFPRKFLYTSDQVDYIEYRRLKGSGQLPYLIIQLKSSKKLQRMLFFRSRSVILSRRFDWREVGGLIQSQTQMNFVKNID